MGRGLRIGYTLGPQLGAHGSDFDLYGAGTSPSTVALTTQAAGSSILVCALGYIADLSAPTDSKGNTYTKAEESVGYFGNQWPGFGLQMFAKANAAGGSSHTVSLAKADAPQESSLLVVEAKSALTLQDTSIAARQTGGAGVSYDSAIVTTTGRALLLSIWAGDGDTGNTNQSAAPGAGWDLIEYLFLGSTAYIQAAIAAKIVATAGDYVCTWTPVQSQGAIVGMAAFQA